MALVDPVSGWVVAQLGDAGMRLVRGSAEERRLRAATGEAIDTVVNAVEPGRRDRMIAGSTRPFSPLPNESSAPRPT
jgi:hypothetical protein